MVLLLGLTIVAWGMNYLFVRVGLGAATPLWLAALRAGTGAVALGLYLLAVPPPVRLRGNDRRFALLIGVPNTAIFLGLWFVAAATVPPGQAAVLIYTYPLWVALFSVPLLEHRLGSLHWVSIAVGFGGIFLVSQPWVGASSRPPLISFLELLASAVSWAISTVLVQRRFRPEQMPAVNGYQILAGGATLLGLALLFDPRHLPVPGLTLWVSVFWLGVVGTAFAYAVWFDLLGKVPAATLSGYAFLVPLVALGASAAFLGERLDLIQGAGVAAVVGSIYGVSRAEARKMRGPQTNDSGARPLPGPESNGTGR